MKYRILFFILLSTLFLPHSGVKAAISDWEKGGTIQPFSTTDFGSDAMMRSLDALRATGANYVALIIPYYTNNRTSTDMYPGWNTPTDDSLAKAIDYAHSIGLHVMLKIHLETDYIEWRGNIDPPSESRPAWFASYKTMLLHYGGIASSHGVEDYAIGAELLHMTNPYFDSKNTDYWKDMIYAVRQIYNGKVTYSANRDFEVDVIGFWPDLDYLGLSAYYELYHAQNNSVDELKKSWDNWRNGVIEPLHNQFNKDIVITEIGYRSITDSYRDPWNWGRGGTYNETDQANAYEAMFSYWQDYSWMKGVYIWRWEINPPAANSGDTDYTPQNKQAQAVLTKWWGGSGSNTGNNTGGNTGTGGTSGGSNTGSGSIISSPSSTLDIWWPSDGAWISGVQPFKGMYTYSDINSYDMFWQVDGDRLNVMYNSDQDYPHKEAWVDVTNWFWQGADGNGPYKLNFVIKDKSGNTIKQRGVDIYVAH